MNVKQLWSAPGQKSPPASAFIGPPWIKTAGQMADRARNDPMPLRGPSGGTFTAERYPEVLRRQHEELLEFTSGAGGRPMPAAAVFAALAVLAAALARRAGSLLPLQWGRVAALSKGPAARLTHSRVR